MSFFESKLKTDMTNDRRDNSHSFVAVIRFCHKYIY